LWGISLWYKGRGIVEYLLIVILGLVWYILYESYCEVPRPDL
jgi:hypothetical protein